MSLDTIMLHQLAIARQVIEGGYEMMPAWRIETSEGAFLIRTRVDPEKPEQREGALFLIGRFLVWKKATSYVLTAETWLGLEMMPTGDEALFTIGVSRHARLAVMQRIRRGDAVGFSEAEWLRPSQFDLAYFKMLPTRATEVSATEDAELTRIFGKTGELPASRVS
jgi:hypothetical protein